MSHENNLVFILFWDGANNIQSCMMCCMSAIKTVLTIACSETLYFLFKVRRARVININRRGFIGRQRTIFKVIFAYSIELSANYFS